MILRTQSHRVAAMIVLGVALHLPCLWWGFFADDYTHQLVLRGIVEHQFIRPWALYDFGTFADVGREEYEVGGFPWWTSREWQIRFFRPLTSVALWLDHALFGGWALGYHLSGLAWYVALLVLVYVLYRALRLSPRTALVALLLFCTSTSSLIPVGWPANRNSLLALTFTVAAVLILSRHRQWGWWAAFGGALTAAILAVLSKESGIIALVLIALYLCLLPAGDRVSRHHRAWGVAVSAVLAVAYLGVFTFAGYGVNSLFYASPWGTPLEFLARFGELMTIGPLSLLGLGSLDFARGANLRGPAVAVAVLVVPWVVWFIGRRIRCDPQVPFLGGWLVLTILPQAAAMPQDRLLFGAAVAAAALLSIFVDRAVFAAGGRHTRDTRGRAVGIGVLLSAGLIAGGSKVAQGVSMNRIFESVRNLILTAEVGPAELGQREVFILQSPTSLAAFTMLATWGVEKDDHDLRIWPMQFGRTALRWTRIDDRSFALESLGAPFLTDVFESVFLAPDTSMTRTFRTALFTVQPAEPAEGGVRRVVIRCSESLDLPRYRFLVGRDGRLVAIDPPDIGQTIELQEVPRLFAMVP